MNEVIKQLQNRRSVREFTGEKIKEEDLQTILATAQRAANSVNGQQTSLIIIKDKEKLEINSCYKWKIALYFVMESFMLYGF